MPTGPLLLEVLKNVSDISQINKNEGQNLVTAAIKAATAPLSGAIAKMLEEARNPSSGKSRRAVSL